MEFFIYLGCVLAVALMARQMLNYVEAERTLPTNDELAQLCEDEDYFKLGMAEVEAFLAAQQPLLLPAPTSEPKVIVCGCASLGESCRICAPHFWENRS
jgi:hypothetical protein